ncbi:5-formyltetrahydrofolate cyclo-ligase [Sinimarinibacterium thermocellulolyticum]|uniref:5-formyltetrahydrofolate cyclo-ligase n=1 Tax=Sinimarinibacterium thermocellulolyticum TaxID=3170016 RepID=A0ABV2A5R9_9GAMM
MRRELRQQRARVPVAARARAAERATAVLARTRAWRVARHVGIYLACGSELPTDPLIRLALRDGKRLYVPRIGAQGSMRFLAWRPGAAMRRNQHGIDEPRRAPMRPWRELDLIIVPLVGFDRSGYRLGAGGGYYDRLFARRHATRPTCLGWALAQQQIPAVPRDPWDRRLDGIVTERGVVWPIG